MSCKCSKTGNGRSAELDHGSRSNIKTLKSVAAEPMIGETPSSALDTWLTPNSLFYIRNHFPIPDINDSDQLDWSIPVEGAVKNPYILKMSDLMKLPKTTVAAIMECAGNNRSALNPKVLGNQFEIGAVGNALWAGASLSDVIRAADVDINAIEVMFEGADYGCPAPDKNQQSYMRSIPIEIARHPDTLLAYEMNGEALSIEHGAPVRLIVPGWYGMASVKWVKCIKILTREYAGYFQTQKYIWKSGGEESRPINIMKVNSCITSPSSGASLDSNPICISGFAWSGRSEIDVVDVSTDGGRTWDRADLTGPSDRYAWQQWNFVWIPASQGHYTIISRATDSLGNIQPTESVWNDLGYEVNGIKSICLTFL